MRANGNHKTEYIMAKFQLDPTQDVGQGIKFSASDAPDAIATNCGWSVAFSTATDYDGIKINGVFTAPSASTTTNALVKAEVVAALLAAGIFNYNVDKITYDGTTLNFQDVSEVVPEYVLIDDVETAVTQLCTATNYNTFKGAGASDDDVEINGSAAPVADATHDATSGLWTVYAPFDAVVTVDAVNAEDCGFHEVRYSA